MTQFHDIQFLQFLQQGYYAWPLLSGAVVVFLLIGLPAHRRVAQVIAAITSIWCLLLIILYGHFVEAPWLACTSSAAMAWAWFRQTSLTGRLRERGRTPTRISLPLRFVERIIRDYFRADPRGVYWLDLARTARGWDAERSPVERRASLRACFELPGWRAILWHCLILPAVGWRIRVWPWLPSFWHLPHDGVSLGEAHIDAILEEEIQAAETCMFEWESGQSFDDYVDRVLRDKHTEALRLAGCFGRKRCLLTEALAESRAINPKKTARDDTLLETVSLYYELWRFRWAHDRLWSVRAEVGSDVDVSDAAQRLADSSGSAESPSEESFAPVLADVEPGGDGFLVSDADPTPPGHSEEKEPSWRTDSEFGEFEELDEFAPDELDGAEDSETVDLEDDDDRTEEDLTVHDEAGMDTFIERGRAASEEEPGLSEQGDVPLEQEPILSDEEPTSPGEDATSTDDEIDISRDDDIAFSAVEDDSDDDEDVDPVAMLDPAMRERLRDLTKASELVDSYLGVEPTGEFSQDIRHLEELRHRPVNWMPTTWLLMLLCFRDDCGRGRQDRLKNATMSRLRSWAKSLASGDRTARMVKRKVQELLVDWYAMRNGYTQIRELFANSPPQTAWQWELLGNANAHIARHMRDRGGLRDDMLREATIAFFRARVFGFWTQRYAGLLLGTSTAEETIRVLQTHPVEFGRSDLQRMLAEQATARAKPEDALADLVQDDLKDTDARPSVGEAKKISKRSELPKSGPQLVLDVLLKNRQELTFGKFPVTIGSGDKNSIRHKSLREEHCRIHYREEELWFEELTRGEGVSINGKPIRGAVELNVGDVFQCEKIRFRVKSL